MKRKLPRRLVAVIVAGLVVTCLFVVVFSSMNGVPEFYRQALATAHPKSRIQGQLFERRLVELSNRMRLDESWSAVLTESQINGWLAADLLEKFPGALPDSISQPRVSMAEDEIHIAFRFHSNSFSGVIQIQGDLFATDVENQIAFRIATVRSGIIPIPISWWGDRLESSLRDRDVVLEWTEIENDLVALITLPATFSGGDQRHSILEAVQLTNEGIGISGRTIHVTPDSRATPVESVADSEDKIQH